METSEVSVDIESLPLECRRQKSESQRNYAAFVHYLTLGRSRSIRATAAALDLPKRNLEQLSAKHEWARRSTIYDEWISEQVLKQNAEDEINQMRERHASQARNWLSILTGVERAWIQRMEDDSETLKELTPYLHLEMIARMGSILNKLQEAEAAARGASYKIAATKTATDKPTAQSVRMIPPVIVESTKKSNE